MAKTWITGEKLNAADLNDVVNKTGMITMFAGAAAPLGFLLCDGSSVSRTTYADLFALIGTTYGAGNGTTTFNLPNLKGKVAVGLDAGQTEFDALGETGGAKTHTLTVNEMPAHTHSGKVLATNAGGPLGTVMGNANQEQTDTGSTGGGAAHNNLQPYIVLNYIIKT
jgi:microcystin-dependent protein